jgi:pectate lyase
MQCHLLVISLTIATIAGATGVADQLPAFPGAEGYGAVSKGGRGGKVVHVTNLDDAGPGSLRAALAVEGPRIIVFDVGGTIELKTDLGLPNDNGFVTIAGQTAPGGITLMGAEVGLPGWSRAVVGTSDIVVRHLRVRGAHNTASPGQGGDALASYWSQRVIFDHCSATGACDETVDIIHSRDVTVQWCTIEEPAEWGQGGAQHSEGSHNTGLISGYPPAGNISLHHNLFAHCPRRNPLLRLGPADIRNNVIYHFGIGHSGSGKRRYDESVLEFNIVGNWYRCCVPRPRYVTPVYNLGDGQYYFADNMLDLADDVSLTFDDPWTQMAEANERFGGVSFWGGGERLSSPVTTPPVTTQPVKKAYELVLARAGAWPRDATTRRMVRETQERTGEYGLSGPYERFSTRTDGPTSERNDTDRDGMTDAWEKQHGLDPNDPADGHKVVPRGASPNDRHTGYTYVEFYLNELADEVAAAKGQTCTVTARVEGEGLVVCEHGGVTPNWKGPSSIKTRGYQGGPLEVAWGEDNVFNRGSIVVLKALPQKELGVGAPVVSKFSHWSGVRADVAKEPVLRLTVEKDVTVTAHFE